MHNGAETKTRTIARDSRIMDEAVMIKTTWASTGEIADLGEIEMSAEGRGRVLEVMIEIESVAADDDIQGVVPIRGREAVAVSAAVADDVTQTAEAGQDPLAGIEIVGRTDLVESTIGRVAGTRAIPSLVDSLSLLHHLLDPA